MGLWELFVIAVGLSMDAFAVSVCKGLSVRRCAPKHMLLCGLYFGAFQAAMPLLGYLLGSRFERFVSSAAPLIAFFLLALIGANMVRESRGEEEGVDDDFSPAAMLPLAVATSVDALAVGVSFALLRVDIVPAVSFIGLTTFVTCVFGVKLGSLFGGRFRAKAELFGGLVLIAMGLKILLEHFLR